MQRITSVTSSAAAVILDEYSPFGGGIVQSISLPPVATGGNYACTQSGSATSEGYGSTSPSGQWLSLPCYDAAVGTASVASASGIGRVVMRVGPEGIVNTSTRFTDNLAGSNIRGAVVADDGLTAWAAGSSGIASISLPHGTSTLVSSLNTRNVQLYYHGVVGPVLLAGAATSLAYATVADPLAQLTFGTVLSGLTALDSQVGLRAEGGGSGGSGSVVR